MRKMIYPFTISLFLYSMISFGSIPIQIIRLIKLSSIIGFYGSCKSRVNLTKAIVSGNSTWYKSSWCFTQHSATLSTSFTEFSNKFNDYQPLHAHTLLLGIYIGGHQHQKMTIFRSLSQNNTWLTSLTTSLKSLNNLTTRKD